MGIPLFGGPKKPKRRTRAQRDEDALKRRMTIAITVSIFLCAAAAAGFVLLDRFVISESPIAQTTGPLRIVDPPVWYNHNLARVIAVAAGGSEFEIGPDTARTIGEKLSSIEWLKNVRVKTLRDHIEVSAEFRKPVALIQAGGKSYYLDAEQVPETGDIIVHVLNYIPIGKLPIVEVTGISSGSIPAAGSEWDAEDAVEAVRLIALLNKADIAYQVANPLINEIVEVNVTNYGGRKYRDNSTQPHIVMIARDGTEIKWGAAVGQAARYFEAGETEKLAQLYAIYKLNGTLQGKSNNLFKYIDLRMPQTQIPRP